MSSQLTAPAPAPPPVPHPTHLRLAPRPRPRRRWLGGDDGMSTVEYAMGTVAAAAFAALLYAVINGDTVLTALTDLVQRALTAAF